MSLTGFYRKLSFRLFVWQGVEVFVDVTALLILVTWVTKDDRIGFIRDKDKFLLGLLIGLGVIISVLVHELAHAWVGILSGAKVSKIYLNVLGGVCVFKEMPTSHFRNFLISIAGPLSNLALFFVFRGLYLQSTSKTDYYLWPPAFDNLAQINFILALFNLLPAYPLDGGQALKSLLTLITGNRLYSAWVIAILGCSCGLGLGFLGVRALTFRNPDVFGVFIIMLLVLLILWASTQQLRELFGKKAKSFTVAAATAAGVSELPGTYPDFDFGLIFKSRKGYNKITADYAKRLKKLAEPVEQIVVNTRFGWTNILASGAVDAPPIVLLMGPASSALEWYAQWKAFNLYYRVYAVDVIGQMGRSAPIRFGYEGPEYGLWLLDVLDKLKLEQAAFVGDAAGCRFIFKLAGFAPTRISRVALLTPAGLVAQLTDFKLPPAIFWTGLLVKIVPCQLTTEWFIRQVAPKKSEMTKAAIAQAAKNLQLYQKYYHEQNNTYLIPEPELAQLTMPTLVLAGRDSFIYNVQDLLIRARQTLPGLVSAELVPDAISDLTGNQPSWVNARLLRFFQEGL